MNQLSKAPQTLFFVIPFCALYVLLLQCFGDRKSIRRVIIPAPAILDGSSLEDLWDLA